MSSVEKHFRKNNYFHSERRLPNVQISYLLFGTKEDDNFRWKKWLFQMLFLPFTAVHCRLFCCLLLFLLLLFILDAQEQKWRWRRELKGCFTDSQTGGFCIYWCRSKVPFDRLLSSRQVVVLLCAENIWCFSGIAACVIISVPISSF